MYYNSVLCPLYVCVCVCRYVGKTQFREEMEFLTPWVAQG